MTRITLVFTSLLYCQMFLFIPKMERRFNATLLCNIDLTHSHLTLVSLLKIENDFVYKRAKKMFV